MCIRGIRLFFLGYTQWKPEIVWRSPDYGLCRERYIKWGRLMLWIPYDVL